MINFKPTDQIKHRLISVLGWRGVCHKMYRFYCLSHSVWGCDPIQTDHYWWIRDEKGRNRRKESGY
jgi:hypothetical protein